MQRIHTSSDHYHFPRKIWNILLGIVFGHLQKNLSTINVDLGEWNSKIRGDLREMMTLNKYSEGPERRSSLLKAECMTSSGVKHRQLNAGKKCDDVVISEVS